MQGVDFDTLKGKAFKSVLVKDAELVFMDDADGDSYSLRPDAEPMELAYCEVNVWLESIDGDIAQHLPGQTIIEAYAGTNTDDPPDGHYVDAYHTWSFYVIRTMRDTFTVRFFGTSNGAYSETASLYRHD